MFSDDQVLEKVKELVKLHNTTQNSLICAVLRRALVDGEIDVSTLDLQTAKPRGRSKKVVSETPAE